MSNTQNLDLKKMDGNPKVVNFNHKEFYENNFDKIDDAVGAKPADLTTTAKTIIPAINELKSDKADKTYVDDQDAALNAQLADKVQNFKLKNEVVNGDFSKGTTGWILNNTVLSEGRLRLTSAVGGTAYILQDKFLKTTEKIYYRFNLEILQGGMRVDFPSSITGNTYNTSGVKSNIISPTLNDSRISFVRDGSVTINDFYIDNVLMMNLTKTFGVGNEPTKLEMDELMKVIPNGWWDGELSLTQKQFITWQLNLIRKNTNAIIALGGTII